MKKEGSWNERTKLATINPEGLGSQVGLLQVPRGGPERCNGELACVGGANDVAIGHFHSYSLLRRLHIFCDITHRNEVACCSSVKN